MRPYLASSFLFSCSVMRHVSALYVRILFIIAYRCSSFFSLIYLCSTKSYSTSSFLILFYFLFFLYLFHPCLIWYQNIYILRHLLLFLCFPLEHYSSVHQYIFFVLRGERKMLYAHSGSRLSGIVWDSSYLTGLPIKNLPLSQSLHPRTRTKPLNGIASGESSLYRSRAG